MINWIIELIANCIFVATILTLIIFASIYVYKKSKGKDFNHKIRTFIFVYYLISLLYVTVYREGLFMNSTRTVNLIPFDMLIESYEYLYTIDSTRAILFLVYNIIGNIIWFIPLGYFINFYMKQPSLWKVFLLSFSLSLSIEFTQFIGYVGISDVDDLIFNTIGGCLGYIGYYLIHGRKVCPSNNK